jgi:spore germination protein YaaH
LYLNNRNIAVLLASFFFCACAGSNRALVKELPPVSVDPVPQESVTQTEEAAALPAEQSQSEETQVEPVIDAQTLEVIDSALDGSLPVSSFKEVWGYLIGGRDADYKIDSPVTDLVLFGAEIDSYGTVVNVPRARRPKGFTGRLHYSIVCGGSGLSHFVLEPGSATRRHVIQELVDYAVNFDGLNVDFESVPGRDGDNYVSFLAELRSRLGRKMLTVAVRALTRENNTYNYAKMEPYLDRMFIMAYDEHWSGSRSGPIASLPWCKNVATYALTVIPKEKLIMGMPFYGRSWASALTARALTFNGVSGVMDDNLILQEARDNAIPNFRYQVLVSVTVYYEDAASIATRSALYKQLGVENIGFWRLGQEDPGVWKYLRKS